MCGRFNLVTDAATLGEFFGVGAPQDLAPRYNIAPSQQILVVRGGPAGRELASLRWGLVPHWAREDGIGRRMINARAETAAEKPAFRDAIRRRRCLIPATGFSEWIPGDEDRQPYHIRIGNGDLFAFAGLWERWEGQGGRVEETCTILTKDANSLVEQIHDRMPVILTQGDFPTWLDLGLQDPEILRTMLLKPNLPARMNLYAVGRWVSKPSNDGPGCMEPLKTP